MSDDAPEILLPQGTTYVSVGDVPNLIANALYPEPTERKVSYLKKVERGCNRTIDLTQEDWRYLEKVWGHLPGYKNNMPESQWRAYAHAFDSAPDKPEWLLVPLDTDGPFSRAINRENAEKLHTALLADEIQRGRLVARTHAMTPASAWDGTLPTARILVEDLIEYTAQLSLRVRLESPHETALRRAAAQRSMVGTVARNLASDMASLSNGNSTDDGSLRYDIKAAIIEVEILTDMQKLMDEGLISPKTDEHGTRAVRPCTLDMSWYLTRSDLEIVLRYTKGNEETKRQYLVELSSHFESGRYTLRQAADYIESAGGEDYKSILNRLKDAALSDELAMYLPGRNQKHDYGPRPRRLLSVRDFYEEAYWNDLNSWLGKYEPRITCTFPAPKSQPQPEQYKHPTRMLDEAPLIDIQQAYDRIYAKTEKAPSQRAVARESGYSREKVSRIWPHLKRVNQPT